MSAETEWFQALKGEQRQILLKLRTLILSISERFVEEIKWSRPCYVINALVCYLHKSKNHFTIGFHHGAHLEDPQGLLEGDGRDMRHVKIPTLTELDEISIRALIQAAVQFDADKTSP
ncbi:MAG: DUF1801 domain-containing protein [Lysobacterales bacterium]